MKRILDLTVLLVSIALSVSSCTLDDGIGAPNLNSRLIEAANLSMSLNVTNQMDVIHTADLINSYLKASAEDKKSAKYWYVDKNLLVNADTLSLDYVYVTGYKALGEDGAEWTVFGQGGKYKISKVAGVDSTWYVNTYFNHNNSLLPSTLVGAYDVEQESPVRVAKFRMLKSDESQAYASWRVSYSENGRIWGRKYKAWSGDVGLNVVYYMKESPNSISKETNVVGTYMFEVSGEDRKDECKVILSTKDGSHSNWAEYYVNGRACDRYSYYGWD